MDVVTVEDRVIGWGFAVSAVSILGLLVMTVLISMAVRQNRRAHARMDPAMEALRERYGWETLLGRFGPAVRSIAPASHRARWQLPDWVRTLAEHGRRRELQGYGPPPPLQVSEPVVAPAPWVALDRNSVPVVGQAPVARRDRWEALDVVDDVLHGRMRAAANTEDTGLIEPIRAEVVQ